MLSRSSLLFAASSLLTGCLSESDTDGSNYFVDDFSGVANLPYPVDQCVVISLTPYYATYSCSDDGSTVTKTTYSDATCETVAEGVDAVEYTSSDVTEQGLYDFNCDGLDNYASVTLCLSAQQDSETGEFDCSSCGTGAPLVSLQATDVCFYGGEEVGAFVDVGCDDDSVDAGYYGSCNSTTAFLTNSADADCSAFTVVESMGLTLYWTYEGCTEDDGAANEDLAVRLSMTHSVFALQALVMVVPLIKLFV